MPTWNDENKSYASSGVGTTALVLSSVATAAVTGLIGGGNGLGGLFGGSQNQNPANSTVYQLAQKDNEIALLKAQQYTDNKVFALSEKVASLDARLIAVETAAPLRDKILSDNILNLGKALSEISVRRVPNYALDPGYGPAFVAPMPPPFPPVVAPTVNNGGTATQTTTSAAA